MFVRISIIVIASLANSFAQTGSYRLFDANNLAIWFSNNGRIAIHPQTKGAGLEYPNGRGKYLVKGAGMIWGCKIHGSVRVGGSLKHAYLYPGSIDSSGIQNNPNDERFRIYRIMRTDTFESSIDYRTWPCGDGAPCDEKGTPIMIGDHQLWWVSNDIYTGPTTGEEPPPIGIEVQTLVWTNEHPEWMRDVVFVKSMVINKGVDSPHDMYLGLWVNFDIGAAGDDYVGCDTMRQMTYGYNSTQRDSSYIPTPACGFIYLQTPVTRGSMNEFGFVRGEWRRSLKNVSLGGHSLPNLMSTPMWPGLTPWYYFLRGEMPLGGFPVDPTTGNPIRFVFPGDPVRRTGWIDGLNVKASDRSTLLSCGPFSMAPRDTQEVVYAILAAQGIDRIQSVLKLQLLADRLRSMLPVAVERIPAHNQRDGMTITPNPVRTNEQALIVLRGIESHGVAPPEFIIVNHLGQIIRQLPSSTRDGGMIHATWDCCDGAGRLVPSGMYMVVASSPAKYSTARFVVVR